MEKEFDPEKYMAAVKVLLNYYPYGCPVRGALKKIAKAEMNARCNGKEYLGPTLSQIECDGDCADEKGTITPVNCIYQFSQSGNLVIDSTTQPDAPIDCGLNGELFLYKNTYKQLLSQSGISTLTEED